MTQISVVIATYRRPLALAHCLAGFLTQTRPADDILLVLRDSDEETHAAISELERLNLPFSTTHVSDPGHVAARNAGLDVAVGDIVAFIDDDAVPRPRWLELIEEHLSRDPAIGAVGGRDWLHIGDDVVEEVEAVVGRLRWYGQLKGRHQLGGPPPREVDTVRGGNMGVRRTAVEELRFDTRLRGIGFQPHDDVAFSLALKRRGWKVFYDPEVAIDHYPEKRWYEQREESGFRGARNLAHNEIVAVLPNASSIRKMIYIPYVFAAGSKDAPGLVQVPRLLVRGDLKVLPRFAGALAGRIDGLATLLRSRRGRSMTSTRRGDSR